MRNIAYLLAIILIMTPHSSQAELQTWESTRKLGSEKEVIADCYAFYTAYGEHIKKFEPNLAMEYFAKVLAGGSSMAINEMNLYRESNPDFSGDSNQLKNAAGQVYSERSKTWHTKIETMDSEQIREQKDICLLMQPKMDALKNDASKPELNSTVNQ